MKESEVWQEASKIWEKREKMGIYLITIGMLYSKDSYYIKITYRDLRTKDFITTTEVRRFLDGLEEERVMSEKRKRLKDLKRKLYHALLGLATDKMTATEIEICYQLSKDSDIGINKQVEKILKA